MADEYIDLGEVFEYGEAFRAEVKKLEGAHPILSVADLAAGVKAKEDKVAAELARAGITRSELRGDSGDRVAAAKAGREALRRFHAYLESLDPSELTCDRAAFFEGGKLGTIAALKPDDVKRKLASVLTGFDAPANASVPGAATWKTTLQARHDALGGANTGHSGAHADKLRASGDLEAARLDFIAFYNGVAKPLVRGLLNLLGRGGEYERFFKDLQVNEGAVAGGAAPAAPAPAAAPPEGAGTTPPTP